MARVTPLSADPLFTFLNQFKCTQEDKDKKLLTHTWLGSFVATYKIPSERYPELYDLVYQRAFVDKATVNLVERFTDPSILKIDLDFEFPIDTRKRQYDEDIIKQIIRLYNKVLSEYLEIEEEAIQAYIFLREKGYRDKGKYKDGFHIMYPEIMLSIPVQKFIRQKVFEQCASIFDRLPLSNRKYDSVIDESIIDRNGWMMYGSTKVGRKPYLLTNVYDFHCDDLEVPTDDRDLIEYLSLYNRDKTVYEIRADKLAEYDAYIKPQKVEPDSPKGKKVSSKIKVNPRYRGRQSPEDLETVKKLVSILDDYRAEDRKQWIDVGLCLFNIDDSLLPTWIEFSKRSTKFQDGLCEESWLGFRHREEKTLGLGSLHRWAMLDDPVGYETVKRGSLSTFIENSMNGTSYAIARVVYEMYKYQYVCTSLRHHSWYEFKGHRWHEIDNGVSLKQKISNEVLNEYLAMNTTYLSKGMDVLDTGKEPYISNAKKLLEVTLKLQDISFKEKVMKECELLFHDDKFLDKLDMKWNLLGFENGVYDLEKDELRDGRPEDYISLSCEIDYVEFSKDDQEILEVQDFMSKVFPIKRVRTYVYKLLASFLQGKNPDEHFHIWEGSGSNGKSKTIELLTRALGQYAGTLPISLLTQKRGSSSAASPELARCRGKRFVSMAEPDRGQRMNIGLMKELTGGDKILCRPLYKEPFEYKPQFKIVLCCNDLPKVPPDDEGTWRRLRVVHFIAKFTKTPNPKIETEFPVDTELADKFDRWKEAFMYLLLQYFKDYRDNGIDEPPEVTQATRDYQKMSDIYVDFLDEYIVRGGQEDYIRLDELFFKFKTWYASNYDKKVPSKVEFRMHMEKKLGRYPERGWKGKRFRTTRGGSEESYEAQEETSQPTKVTDTEPDSDDDKSRYSAVEDDDSDFETGNNKAPRNLVPADEQGDYQLQSEGDYQLRSESDEVDNSGLDGTKLKLKLTDSPKQRVDNEKLKHLEL